MAKSSTTTSGVPRKNPATAVAPKGKADTSRNKGHPARSIAIAQSGVRTGEDFANLMSALMSDVIDGSIDPIAANAACNAGGKLLKIVEMQYQYGSQPRSPSLVLAALGPEREAQG